MKIQLRGYAYSITIALISLISINEAKAQFKDTVIYDFGTYSSGCYICGSGYDCFTSNQQLLIDNNNLRISEIKVKVFHTSCGSGNFYAIVNGDTLGSFTRSYSCSCSDCYIDSIVADYTKLGNYNSGDTNFLWMGGMYTCTDKIMIIRTYSFDAYNDAGIMSVDSPYRACAGSRNIVVSVANFGRNRIDSVKVNWTWNGVAQTPYNYIGTIDTIGGSGANKVKVTIGSKTLILGKTDTLVVWTRLPNGVADTSNRNDTMLRMIKPSLKDTITVGGSNPNYSSVQAAINDLQTYGVCGKVVVNIRPGTYTEQLKIGNIPGADSLNHITFRSSTGDSSDVLLSYGSSLSNLNYTLLIENARHIRFTQLTIEATGTTYARVIDFKSGFRNISFSNCLISGYSSSSSSSNRALVFNSGSIINSIGLYFDNCEFRDGSYAILFTNSSGSSGLRIKNCFADGQAYANLQVYYMNNLQIHDNTFMRSSTSYTYGYGIYLYDISGLSILRNKVIQPNGGYGIYLEYATGTSNSRTLVANNFISVGSNDYTDAWGFYSYYCDYLDFYNNSIYASTLYTGDGNIYIYRGSNIRIRNNALHFDGSGGYQIYHNYSGSNAISSCNNNTYYGGGILFYNNNAITGLSNWKNATSFDSASTVANPNFVSGSDLHAYSSDLNAQAIPDARITTDIDLQTRNSSLPDIGADEFDLVPLDAGITEIKQFTADSVCVYVSIKNHGDDTLTSAQINWRINGNAKTSYSWSGSLLSGKSATVCIGTHRFSKDTVYTVRAWTSAPNGSSDTMNFNDTFERIGKPALRGVYTIGGTNPDFATFNAAITAMTDGGIIDSVLFKVRSGTYTERLVIPLISGAERKNAIVFESSNKDSSSVTLQYSTSWSEYEMVELVGAQYISFRYMSFKNTGSSSPRRCIAMTDGSSFIEISNCRLESNAVNSTDNYYDALIYISNQESDIQIRNSYFKNGASAIYSDYVIRLTVRNNLFENAYYMGVYFYQTDKLDYSNNKTISNSAYNGYYGAYIYYLYGTNYISGNTITGPNKSEYTGMYIYYIPANSSADTCYIFNNNISVGGNNAQQAFYLYDAENTYINNNNFHYYGSYSGSLYAARMRYLYNCKVFNNNFIENSNNSGTGYAVEFYSLSQTSPDYNNFIGSGSNLTYVNFNIYASLAAMQSAGREMNSISSNPGFVSNTDLHVEAAALNAKGKKLHFLKIDIDGEKRDSISPDIGSDEFTPKQRDAGVIDFISPGDMIEADTVPIKVAIANFGVDTLFSVKVRCIINGDTLASVTINDTLLSGDSMHAVIGSYIFERDSVNNLLAWTYDPNNGTDQKFKNDSFSITNRKTAMSGVYTIGGSSPDFVSFKAALAAMYNAGISGQVRFRVRNGTYTEQLRITPISGAGALNSVIFESESLDSSLVILRFNSTFYDTNYVVFLRGADGITFRHMTINSMNSNYGTVVLMEEGANRIIFRNNILKGVSTSTTSGNMSVIASYNSTYADEYNQFVNNVIENGSYGLYLYGNGQPQNREREIVISGNTLKNQYYMGMYLRYQRNLFLHNNNISSNSSYSSYYGIYGNYIENKSFITSNRILRSGNGYYGIYLYELYGNSDTILVANNVVNIGGTSNANGIYAYYNYNVHYIHNTIRLGSGTTSSGSCFYYDNGSNCNLLNNIFENTGAGYAIQAPSPGGLAKSDYNNLRTKGTFLARWNSNNYSNLTSLRAGNSKDANSMNVDPMFVSSEDLHSKQIDLNAAAVLYPKIKDDFEGELRDTATRDIGADEFTPPALDAGILEINNPKTPFLPDTQNIRVVLKNFGQNTINSVDIDWTFNDTAQSTYSWTGSLASKDTVHIILAQKFFIRDSIYRVSAWTSLPNNYNDTINGNDTARSGNIYPALSGTYTIGGAGPDFNTFTDAVNALKRGGIIGQVIFNVRNGTYTEKLLIPAIVGTNGRHSIIFQSESKDSSKVTLNNNSNTSGVNYTVKLNGASGITFRYMTISSGNSSYGRVVEIDNGSSFNSFSNNVLETVSTTSATTNLAIVYIYNTGFQNRNNHFTKNVFKNGAYGLYNYGYLGTGLYDKNLLIEDNIFDLPYYTGINLYYSDTAVINRNKITVGNYNSAYGIIIEYCRGKFVVTSNNIVVPNAYMGLYIYNLFATSNNRSLVANNMISALGNNAGYGFYFYGSYLDFYSNNINMNTSGTGTYAAMFTSSSNVRSVNNIYNHSGSGYALYTSSSSTITESNYNCYRSNGSNLAYWNGNRANLSALQSANGKDANSISIDPNYVSSSDLHVRAIALDKAGKKLPEIKFDIDGRQRDTLLPDIGADEFDIPSPDDAGIFKYIGPKAPFAAGSNAVEVVITNFGSDTLTSATIHWKINNVAQTAFNWTGSLKSGSSDTVSIGNYNFNSGVLHTLQAWTSSPNGVTDTIYYNDTLKHSNIFSALDGVYTIGGSVPDFNTFADARNALMLGGVIDTVVFNVRNGTYTEQIQLNAYPGALSTRPVTFKSESGDSSKVILQSGASDYVLSLNGADFVSISKMTIKNTFYYGAHAITIANNSNNITISNCRVQITYNYYYYSGTCIFSGTDRDNNTVIRNNYLDGGYYGIQLYGGGSSLYETGTVIEGNRIDNSYSSAIHLVYHDALLIRNNQINLNSSYGSYGIRLAQVSNDINISRNKIISSYLYTYGIVLENHSGSSTKKGLIANNFISIKDPYYYGIYINSSSYPNIFYNSVHLYGNNNNSNAACLFTTNVTNADIKNNIFSNQAGSLAYYVNGVPTISNYNDLYATGTNLCRNNATLYTSIAAWRSATSRDVNSKSVNPTFFSNTDLHTTLITLDSAATPISGLTEDIDGNTRNTTKPDIGADEFNSLPNNLSVTAILNPLNGCEIGKQVLTITIFNFGSNTQKNFGVSRSVNGGSIVSETFTDSILPGTGKNFTFTDTLSTAAIGDYNLVVWTDANSEQYRLNDTLKRKVSNYLKPDSVGTMIPADNSINISFPFSLSWSPSQGATLYDIYIWADSINTRPGSPNFANQTQISRQITSGLGYGVKYKWQVIAKNPSCATEGPVQKFTIRNLPDLQVMSISSPTSSFSGNTIAVAWSVKNTGAGNTGGGTWYDNIFLSKDKILDGTDVHLGGVTNPAALNVNQSYNNNSNVTLPEGISGTHYIIVRTDAYNYLTESNEGNNITSDSSGMSVSLTPPPDLNVTMVTRPTTAFSGQPINIEFRVKNIGSGGTRSSLWRDYIYLHDDSSSGGTFMKSIQHNGALDVDSIYRVNTTITLPLTISGRHFIIIKTDAQNNVYEHASESNNERISLGIDVILTPPPDLVVKNVDLKDTVSNREAVNVSYQLINQGGTATNTYWVDQIYISKFSTFNVNSSTLLNSYYRQNLNDDDTQFQSPAVTIPEGINGKHYIYVTTNLSKNQFEGVNDTNNISAAIPVHVNSPDLVVRDVTAPQQDTSGKQISVSYAVRNLGPGNNPLSSRTDKIYISRHPVYHADSVILIGSLSYSASINAGASINKQATVTIPNGTIGNRYIFVMADANVQIFENNKDTNNIFRSDTMLVKLAPYPDLKPIMTQSADSSEAGAIYPFTYEVINQGLRNCITGWKDFIYISKDSVYNPLKVTQLRTNIINPALEKDSTYTVVQNLLLSNKLSSGYYYFYVFTDADNQRYEYLFENNNIFRSKKIFIDGYPPVDLEVLSVVVPDTIYSGTDVNFEWSVKNSGQAATIANTWFDRIYLSADSLIDGSDKLIGESQTLQNLGKDSVYNRKLKVKIPNGISGQFCLIVRTDYRDDNADIDTLNNIMASLDGLGKVKYIRTLLSKSSDLQITSWEIPSAATSGQPARFIWKVENKGDTTTKSGWWNDRFYLSTDYTLDGGDQILGTVAHNGNILKNGSYTDTAFLFMPSHTTGNFIVLIKTDEADREYEHNAENNNMQASAITLSNAPPGDLIVSSVTAPDSIQAGSSVSVSYQIKNIGSNPISGSRTDNLYVSADSVFDGSDLLIATHTESVSMVPNASRNLNLNGKVTGIPPGNYHFILFTDVKDNINESRDTNNTGYSELCEVSIPVLPMNVLTPDTMDNQENIYYRINIPDSLNGESVLVTLKGDSTVAQNELFLRFGAVPSRFEFDYGFSTPFFGNQEIIIPEVMPGVYYLLAYGNTSSGPRQNIKLLARKLDFEIRKVSPGAGGNTGQVTMRIEGSKFDTSVYFVLQLDSAFDGVTPPGYFVPSFDPDSVYLVDPTLAYTTFNLLGHMRGSYHVIGIKNGDTVMLRNSFIIDLGLPPDLQISVIRPSNTRANSIITIEVHFTNAGNMDIVNSELEIISTAGAPISFTQAGLSDNKTTLKIKLVEDGAPPGLLRPKGSGSVIIYTTATAALGFNIILPELK